MKVIGIDLGSREVKLVITDENTLLEKRSFSTIHFYRNFCRYEDRIIVDLEKLGYQLTDFNLCISTGYGRNNIDLQNFKPISEIKAHVHGAAWQSGLRDFVLLDLGGQDIKIVQVANGMVCELDLNDKCAASCGRYLENMAQLLEISMEELGTHHLNPVELNSTCAVFSESELIGKIAEGIPLNNLCAGVNDSMVRRMLPMVMPYAGNPILVSGGAALNRGVIHLLNQATGDASVLNDPQFNGAMGCCRYGIKQLQAPVNLTIETASRKDNDYV